MHIALIEPEIPSNAGNIARTCVLTGTRLHLVKPLGFSLDDRYLKRAGLDYWQYLDLEVHNTFVELKSKYPQSNFYFFTTKGKKLYTDIVYNTEDFLVFGKETAGLPQHILEEHESNCVRIPMSSALKRSLNLSNAVAIALYEALRKQSFPGLL
ncbi:MAG: tRNA (cytidine(34)-2'-O)-methyltransferase [Dethiobacteria bacterium]|jgi:tRNA (cytidine/uridine-2'-O-)-methyltransferase|nr:tRNA (cytidine(34)-2'-O)-methyltransferase [Bacillota bacterium]